MPSRLLLTIAAFVALSIGSLATFLPATLLTQMKGVAAPSGAALAMTRTVGVLLLAFGVLNLLARDLKDQRALTVILASNLFLQAGLLPLDPWTYLQGVFGGLGSFVPNTILHILLIVAFAVSLLKQKRSAVI